MKNVMQIRTIEMNTFYKNCDQEEENELCAEDAKSEDSGEDEENGDSVENGAN